MSENTGKNANNAPKQEEQYSLNDDRRVKVLSPGTLVAKRFFRNRLAVIGLSILVAMFLFSFLGGVISPYGQDEQFYTYTQMSKEYVGVTRNEAMRFTSWPTARTSGPFRRARPSKPTKRAIRNLPV